MIRFWFEFEKFEQDDNFFPKVITNWGCGVTAHDKEDAINILQETIFVECDLPPIKTIIQNIDVSLLDKAHVQPNMGNILTRGVWFPQGHYIS